MEFKKYMHIERFGNDEVQGIELGECFIFPKLDGTNGSIWWGNGIQAGSRKRELSIAEDNAGFCEWVQNGDHRLCEFFSENHLLRLHGEWLCLAGDTKIKLLSGGKRGHTMTIKEMYDYATTPTIENQHYIKKDGTRSKVKREPWWERYSYPQTFSLYINEDRIRPQKIKAIISTGLKPVYKISTRKGYSIKSTKDHKFYTNHGWRALGDIKVGDVVAVSELYNHRTKRRYGKGSRKIKALFDELRSKNCCCVCGGTNSLEVHHKDENWQNNDESNLEVVCRECHSKKHNNVTATNQAFNYEYDKVIDIKSIGVENCYDISMCSDENSASFIANGFIVHNCPHSLKTYRNDAWRKFYVFDVEDYYGTYLNYSEYQPLLEGFGIDYIPPLCVMRNATYDNLLVELQNNFFLIQEGNGCGEGIVIKNYGFANKFGKTIWAKIVTNEFKEKHVKVMGPTVKNMKEMPENVIAYQYVTKHLVDKVYAKIVNEMQGWNSRYIPRLLSTVFYDLVNEEIWNAVKKMKNPTVNFKTLNSLTIMRVKELKPELF